MHSTFVLVTASCSFALLAVGGWTLVGSWQVVVLARTGLWKEYKLVPARLCQPTLQCSSSASQVALGLEAKFLNDEWREQ